MIISINNYNNLCIHLNILYGYMHIIIIITIHASYLVPMKQPLCTNTHDLIIGNITVSIIIVAMHIIMAKFYTCILSKSEYKCVYKY